TTTYSTFTLRSPGATATIGRPIANTRIYILDANFQPVPVGVQGEIFIGGAGVARGYLNRPQLSREKFLPDPFVDDKRACMYRTGDFARYFPDGSIEYLGRADHQVKIRGYRIELGEIEAALSRHPAISQTVVVARAKESSELVLSDDAKSTTQNPQLAKQLVAYFVRSSEPLPTVGELRSFLGEKLPEFMLPEVFIALEELPLNPNGKIDRSALPAPDGERPQLFSTFDAPRTEVEELIGQAWREALKVDQVGVHDNFFALGGHSLLATRVVARLGATFGVDLPLRKLFELPTIAALARHVEDLRQNWNGVTAPPIIPVAIQESAPLSFAQRRLWFLHKLEADLTAYNMPAVYRIKGALNIGALENAFSEIIKRHDSLRTAIVEIDGQPRQQIVPISEIKIPIVDLTSHSATEVEAEIAARLNQEARHLFDLRNAPLMRLTLLRLAMDEHVLLVNFHHIICDGSSLVIAYRELGLLYDALLNGQPADLPRIPLRYADFAAWQESWLQEPAAEIQLNYWQRQLANLAGRLELPADYERPTVQSYCGARATRRLPMGLVDELKQLSRRQGVTLFMTLLAALKILLGRLSGQTDI
ncbi:MAG TPA: condensation domain-containing protein, partial [Candidatus Binatia bacterium]|nr:condensation domain-containing protein [Candidatus Binatia bacterium]